MSSSLLDPKPYKVALNLELSLKCPQPYDLPDFLLIKPCPKP